MAYFAQEPYSQSSSQASSVRQTRQGRNASSFNILSHDPANSNFVDTEKQMKKEKQNLYKDQLDHMVHNKQAKSALDKQTNNYSQSLNAIPSRERQGWGVEASHQQQLNQDAQRRAYEGYGNDDYGLPPHVSEIEKNYNLGNKAPENYAEFRKRSPPKEATTVAKSFDTQDELRNQLLNKIRSGYNNQNYNVYDAYQRAHEEKEYQRQNFEHNVIDKYAREKVAKEQQAALNDWEKKKNLKQEMHEANRRAMEAKSAQKKREKEFEEYLEHKKLQDTLARQEMADAAQKDKVKRQQQDNLSVLKQQMQESALRKFDAKDHLAPTNFKIGGGYDSIDQSLAHHRDQPLQNSSQLNQDRVAGYKPRQSDEFSIGMGNLNIGGPSKAYQDDPYHQNYDNPVQPLSSRNNIQGGSREAAPVKPTYDRFRHGQAFNIITGEYR